MVKKYVTIPPPEKTTLQFKVGRLLFIRIDRARVIADVSRNHWIGIAINHQIYNTDPTSANTSAEEILNDKITIVIRVDPLIAELINEICEDRNVSRTIWLIDACLGLLEKGRNHV
jgi:hypothetical protein